jgi:HD-GYP domain-containing protein (c-di-GMP phosphodiesterase class II)
VSEPTEKRPTLSQPLPAADADIFSKGPNAILFAFYQLFKTAQMHAIDNQALIRPIQTMFELSTAVFKRDGRVSLQMGDRVLFLNGTRLKVSTEEYEFANRVFEFFREHGMAGFDIDAALTPDSIRKVLQILVYAPPQDRTFEKIDAALKAAQIGFNVIKPEEAAAPVDEEITDRRELTFYTYSKLVVLYRALMAEEKTSGTNRQFFVRKIVRAIHELVDIAVVENELLVAAASAKDSANYPSHHAANVALLAIALGRKVGVGKVDLGDLGVAAVFHDIGLRACPAELLEKGGALDSTERAIINQHPIQSVEFLLGERRFTKSALSRIIVAFEHHRTTSGTGYPPGSRKPDLFSRIVSVADVYDALTTRRPWRKAFRPDVALGMMLRDSGQRFDPALLSAFVNLVGLYPIGTLVRLDTGEMGVVVQGGGEGKRVSRPIVLLLDEKHERAQTVDLLEEMPDGVYRRTIVGSEDPLVYGIQTSGYVARAEIFAAQA